MRRGAAAAAAEGLLLLVLCGGGAAWGCPAACECEEAGRTVRCVGRNLSEVPGALPAAVRELVLSGNRIVRLAPGALSTERAALAELRRLVLSDNGLEAVSPGALAGLPRLRHLDLRRNRLAAFGPDAFGNASGALQELDLAAALAPPASAALLAQLLRQPGLQRLDLSGNRLRALPAAALAALPALQRLDLHDNALAGLAELDFSGLARLQSLDLSANALARLANHTVQQLRALPLLSSLDLRGNPWHCDCHLQALAAWLHESQSQPVQAKESLRCASPQDMQGRPLLGLRFSASGCPVPAAEDDQAQLQTSYVFLGIVLALIGAIFLLVLYLNRKGIKKWMYNIRDACRDHMEGYHYRYEINAEPRLTHLSSNSDV